MEAQETEVQATEGRKDRQTKTGVVVSNKTDKTITVRVQQTYIHPLYRRYVKKSKKFTAHDEQNQCNEGDVVSIVSCRPLSKTKRWRLKEVVKRAE